MFNADDGRRKGASNNNLKNVFGSNSHNTLISALDKKRQDHSKDKFKPTLMPQHNDCTEQKGSAVITFRNIKNNQNQQNNHKVPKQEFYQLKINKKTSATETHNQIQINLNMQNMLVNRRFNAPEPNTDRSLSQRRKDDEKNKKISKVKLTTNTSILDEFECDEQLEFRPERRTEKKIIVTQPNSQKTISQSHTTIKSKIIDPIDLQRQLKQFDVKCEDIDTLAQSQAVMFLDMRQLSYVIDPLYIQKKQKQLNWTMRAILMDWMMHICFQFRLKRQTLHIALTLVDNFFQTSPGLTKADFQLTGAAALFIAAKLQQFQPLSSKQFAKSTKERYSAEQIKQMEMRICKALKFNLHPPTINMWANKIMQQWDLFLDSPQMQQQPFFLNHQSKYFKKIDQDSYKNYRQMMQILDCAILDIQTVQYKPKILVCSLLYLILGKEFGQFSKKKITTEFPRTSIFFVEDSAFNSMFRYFLEQSFGLEMFELLPSVQYLASYLILPLCYDRPCLRAQEESMEDMHMEEYCSFQTYNPNMMAAVRKRFRGIYQ